MFYTVIEIQEDINSIRGSIATIYDDYNDALGKLYTVLSAAASSNLPYHACFILRSDGIVTDGRTFDRKEIV